MNEEVKRQLLVYFVEQEVLQILSLERVIDGIDGVVGFA